MTKLLCTAVAVQGGQLNSLVEGVLGSGECAGQGLLVELVQTSDHLLTDVSELLDELGLEVAVHAQQVLSDQNLAVNVGASTDTQDGHLNSLGNSLANANGDALQNDCECASLFQSLSVLDQL